MRLLLPTLALVMLGGTMQGQTPQITTSAPVVPAQKVTGTATCTKQPVAKNAVAAFSCPVTVNIPQQTLAPLTISPFGFVCTGGTLTYNANGVPNGVAGLVCKRTATP